MTYVKPEKALSNINIASGYALYAIAGGAYGLEQKLPSTGRYARADVDVPANLTG